MALADGWYSIRAAASGACAGVINGSPYDRAGVGLFPRDGSAAWQLFELRKQSDGTWLIGTFSSSWTTGGSQMWLRSYPAADGAMGGDVRQSSTSTKWAMADTGKKHVINGVSCPLYTIKSADGYLSDNGTGGAMVSTTADTWCLVPDITMVQGYAAPSALMLSSDVTTTPSATGCHVQATAKSVTVTPSWVQGGTDYQLRYRVRWADGPSTFGAWSAWKALADGSTGNGGWGTKGQSSTVRDGRNVAASGIPLDFTDHTRCQLQYEVRMADTDHTTWLSYRRGNEAGRTFVVAKAPAVTATSVAWSPEFLVVGLSATNAYGTGNTVGVEVEGWGEGEARNVGATPTVAVKIGSMTKAPKAGTTVPLMVTWDCGDGLPRTTHLLTGTLSMSAATGLTMPPLKGHDGYLTVAAGTGDGSEKTGVWVSDAVDGESDGYGVTYHKMRRDADNNIVVAVPQDVTYRMIVTLGTASSFGIWNKTMSSSMEGMPTYRLVWESYPFTLGMPCNVNEPPRLEWDAEASVDAQQTNAGGFDKTTVGPSVSQTGTLTGVLEPLGEQWRAARVLDSLVGKCAWLTTHKGEILRVVVGHFTTERHAGYTVTKLSLRRIDG